MTAKMLFVIFLVGCFGLVFGRSAPAGGINGKVLAKLDMLASEEHLLAAVKFGEDVLEKSKRMENTIADSRVKLRKGSISHAQLIDGYPTPSVRKQDYVARSALKAASFFLNSYCKPQRIPSYDCGLYLGDKSIPKSALLEKCNKIVAGKTFNDQYRRLLPAKYHDGIYQFRKSSAGSELPHPRSISSKFHGSFTQSGVDNKHSVALVQWSQFIEHDLSKTAVQSMHDGTDIECCTSDHNSVIPRYLHPSCAPLYIESSDPYYKKHHVTCLNYVRSALSLGDSCKLGPANQLNHATYLLDLSQLYGTHSSETKLLRSNKGGKLKSQLFDSSEYLIEIADKSLCVSNETVDGVCYESGDSRVNVNPYITLLHTLFLRSHNRIAKHLALDSPHWSDERLFGMARKINTKIYQMIVRDWMEAVLGSSIELDHVSSDAEEHVSNEFATAAIRFYNTMMPGEITNQVSSGRPAAFDLEKLFYKPKDLRKKDYFSHVIGSVLQQHAMSLDTSYVDDMAQLLFKTRNVGTDVLALDIQRGRDHGLDSYINYYKLCTGKSINSWSDLDGIFTRSDRQIFQAAYTSVQDIDLIVGAIAEKVTNPEAIVGPTLACLIKEQMSHSLKVGVDQYQSQPQQHQQQRQIDRALANYSAARFLCDTAQLGQVQRNIFRLPADDNPLISCLQLPGLDLSALRDV